jgi:hypothetical protein
MIKMRVVETTRIFARQLGFIVLSAPKAQKLLPGEKLAKIFDF